MSCCSYRHVATRFEKYPHLLANLLQLLFTICNTCKPFVATTYCLKHLQTFCGCYLSFITPIDHLWLLPIIYSTCRPFIIIAYCLQHRYLPYKPQILGLPLCCYLPLVVIVLWQKIFPNPETIVESGNVLKKNEKIICEHNKTLYDTNMNYYFLSFHTLSRTKNQQKAINFRQPFSIT